MSGKRKAWTILLIGAAVVVLVAAFGVFRSGKSRNVTGGDSKRKLLCTTYPVYLFVREVAKGSPVQPEPLLPPETGCPHDYSLTPGDLMKLSGKNTLLIRNGLGLDDALWKTALAANPELKSVSLCEGAADVLHEDDEEEEGDEADHGHGEACGETSCGHEHHHHHEGEHGNGHLFASPDTAIVMAENAVRALSEFDPENAALYKANGERFCAELRNLSGEFRAAGLKGRKIAVQHDIFAYLARLSGMEIEVSLHAEESQSLSPARIARICREIREKKVTVLYAEPQYSKETAELIAREAGIVYCVLDPCASGPEAPGPGYYVNVMRENLKKLRGGDGK